MTHSDDLGSQSNPLRARAGSESVRVFETIKRNAVTEMGSVLSGFWSSVEEQVRLAALAGHDYGANQDDRVAVAALHHRALELATRYREAIEREFDRWLSATPEGSTEKSLSLMSEDELEIHLAGQQTTELLDHQFLHPLELLGERLQALANALGVQGKRPNPMRPEAAVSAFTDLFGADDLTPGLRVLVFSLHDKRLPHALGTIYERTNAALEGAGFGGLAPATGSKTRYAPQQASMPPQAQPDPGAGWMPDGGVVEHTGGLAPDMSGVHGLPGLPSMTAMPAMAAMPAAVNAAFAAMAAGLGGLQQAAMPQAGMVQAGMMQAGMMQAAMTQQQAAAAHAAMMHAHEQAGRPPRYRDVVREQLRTWRARIAEAAQHAAEQATLVSATQAAGHGRVLATEEMLSVAQLLQGDDPTPFTRALAGESQRPLANVIREELLGGVRQLGFDPAETSFSTDEEDAIDLVGMLFQSLFEANDLLHRARAMYGRLVVPYLKVALTDDSMFNRRSHPARKLLDALTEACDGNTGETPQDRETLECAEHAVDRVVTDFQEDQAIFELAASELRDQLDQQRKRSELAEKRAAEAIHGRERLQHARRAADDLVASRLTERPLTRAVADFLDGQWRHYLTQTWLRDGPESQRHRTAIAVGDAMVQVDTDAAHARGTAVADQLLALQVPLGECYSSCGMDAGNARDAMARIIAALGLPDTVRGVHAPQPGEETESEPAEDENRPDLRLVGGTATLAFDPTIAARMRRLRVGQGLRLVDDEGRESAARIAWISPLTSRLLLVNRRGMRKMVISPEELAVMVASGQAVVRAVDAPFDEAMKQLWQNLNQPAPATTVAAAS
jgi:hypothetical protein